MEDVRVLIIISIVIIGFGIVPLLGGLLPRDDEDDS